MYIRGYSGSRDSGTAITVSDVVVGMFELETPLEIVNYLNGIPVPEGGDVGQVLGLVAPGVYEWIDGPSAANGLPSGGTAGQFLKKSSSLDYDAEWADLNELSWIKLVTGYSTTPVLIDTIASGDVYEYLYNNDTLTLYRLVPSGLAQDSFYTTFSSGVLSGFVIGKEVEV